MHVEEYWKDDAVAWELVVFAVSYGENIWVENGDHIRSDGGCILKVAWLLGIAVIDDTCIFE